MDGRRNKGTDLFTNPALSLKWILSVAGASLITLLFANITNDIEEDAKIKAVDLEKKDISNPISFANRTNVEERAKIKASKLERKDLINPYGTPASPGIAITRLEIKAVDTTGKETMDDAITCLARSIYWEARGTDRRLMQAIANVVINRLASGGFPGTICGIVKQRNEEGRCQFSWWCDCRPDSAQEAKPYEAAKEIARKALNRQLKDLTRGALYFHGRGVKPHWNKEFIRTARIEGLTFYRPPRRKTK